MRYTTVIFDLDGTLLNTLEDIKDSVNATMRAASTKYAPSSETGRGI